MVNYYNMNMDENYETISRYNTKVSEYQAEIDAWLLKGNTIKKFPQGHRVTESKIPVYWDSPEENAKPKLMQGHTMLDEIELRKGKEYNLTAEDLFDNPEKF